MTNLRNTWYLLGAVRSHFGEMLLSFLAGLFNQLFAIIGASLGAYLVGIAATDGQAQDLWWGVAGLFGIVLLRATLSWFESWLGHDLAYRVLATLRMRVYWSLEKLAPAYIIRQRSGNIVTTAMRNVESLEVFYAHIVPSLAIAVIIPLGVLLVLSFINIWLVLILLPFLLLEASVPLWLSRRAKQQGEHLEQVTSELNADTVDGIQGLRELAIFGANEAYLEKLRQHSRKLRHAQISYVIRNSFEKVADATIIALGVVCVALVAGWQVKTNQISFALYPLSVVLTLSTFGPIMAFNAVAGYLGLGLAAADSVFNIIHDKPVVEDKPNASVLTHDTPTVRFENVSFCYESGLEPALQNVSFEANPAEMIALVGHSGAGKSTCGHLLLRFWDVNSGSIKLADHDIRDYDLETLREQIAIVPQDTYLFNYSILENIRLGKPTATDLQVEAAAQAALAHDFIMALPDGYKTIAGEHGLQLSGGQRQRLAIARALLKDAPVLWMDEAVSNLDVESEKLVQEATNILRKGRTTIVIAHRLSTILAADRVIVFEGGQVVETGSHDSLVALNNKYAQLIAGQQLKN